MEFSSCKFIFEFLPAFLAAYYMCRDNLRGIVLLLGSLWFYYLGAGIEGVGFLISELIICYFFARFISNNQGQKRKGFLIASLLTEFGFLFYYKYTGFFCSIFSIEQTKLISDSIILPLGISFFTFQITAYLIDIYRAEVSFDQNPICYLNTIIAFPKLISGPLIEYKSFSEEIKRLDINSEKLEEGFAWFVLGLGMKVLIADSLSTIWENLSGIGYESISTTYAWLGALSYSLQLYFDFKGYSLMALGIGCMIGLTIPENFIHPYTSSSVSEFWRRWHVTLGAWFKKYLYIPLGGSKSTKKRMIISLFVVWIVTGLWHGAGWNFILWGMVHFLFILAEKLFLNKELKKHTVLSHLYFCFYIIQTWVIFAIDDISDIGQFFLRLYPFFDNTERIVYQQDFVPALCSKWVVLIAGLFLCLPIAEGVIRKYHGKLWLIAVEFVIFWESVSMIIKNGANSFMYFAF